MDWNDLFTHEMKYPPALPEEQGGGVAAGGMEEGQCDAGASRELAEASVQPDPDAVARLLPGGGGVYLLTDDQDRVIQLSAAADLRRALRTRMFEPVAEADEPVSAVMRRRAKLGEIVRKIRWRPGYSMFEIDLSYLAIARAVMPDRYLKNLSFGPAWWVHVDPAAAIPRFIWGKVLDESCGTSLGPFATQSDAGRFIQILEDAFNLCRCYDSLGRAPSGTTCAYYEMGKCPAPCSGMIPMERYREMISAALAFACGQRQASYEAWRREMHALAAEQAFERAAIAKQRLERAQGIEHAAFRFVRPLGEFNYLVVQRGRGRISVIPFFVRRGHVSPGQQVRVKQLEAAVPEWLTAMHETAEGDSNSSAGPPVDTQCRSEQTWLVSHYLFKRDPPGLFIHASELDNPEAVAGRITERFGKAAVDSENETR